MGTRGFIAYRLRGRYYITYNHYDSDPPNLGARLITEIPSDPIKFQGNYDCSPSPFDIIFC